MGLFKKKSGSVPNRAAAPTRRPVQSTDQWAESLKQRGAATPEGKAISEAADKKIAKNAWESNQSKMRAQGDAAWKAKYDKPEPKQKQSGGFVHAEGGRAISTERM
jgi:hypothetical protein